jgi:hypothetical protein
VQKQVEAAAAKNVKVCATTTTAISSTWLA